MTNSPRPPSNICNITLSCVESKADKIYSGGIDGAGCEIIFTSLCCADADADTDRRNGNIHENGEERGPTYVQSNWL